MPNKSDIQVVYYQRRLPGKDDSFWYEGDIATLTLGRRQVLIEAAGDIRIVNYQGDLCWDNSGERNDGIPGLINDKALAALVGVGKPYHWENNNWFELSVRLLGRKFCEDITLDPEYEYRATIKGAMDLLIDDEFWSDCNEDK